jgi:hypothetical protein
MHFERAKGTMNQNRVYCSKDNNFITNIAKINTIEEDRQAMLDVNTEISYLDLEIMEVGDDIPEKAYRHPMCQPVATGNWKRANKDTGGPARTASRGWTTGMLDGLWAIADTLLRYDSGGFGGLDLWRDCEDPRTPHSAVINSRL